MIVLLSIFTGVAFFIGGCWWLWYMLARPKQWARFTEAENAFWVKRGFPAKWAGAMKECEQGRGLKVLVAIGIIFALVLTITPFILPFLFPPHR